MLSSCQGYLLRDICDGGTSSDFTCRHGSTVRRNAASDQQCLEMEGSRGQRVLGAPLHAGGLMSDGSKTGSLEVEMLEVEMCFNTALSS
ncbi:hypothetical protein BST67_13325 [Bradyrhizobium canariense]|nr:hypothetical protein BST67_13325 [Bradyrhizobium canariense]